MILHAKYPKLKIIGFPRLLNAPTFPMPRIPALMAFSLDPHIDMDWAAATLPRHIVIQGNLDPALLKAGGKEMKEAAEKIIAQMKGRAFISISAMASIKRRRLKMWPSLSKLFGVLNSVP